MRFVGILIMAVSIAGGGFLLAERGKKRLELLLKMRRMIHYLKSQILYSNAPLPEAVWEVGCRFDCSGEEKKGKWEPASLFLNVRKQLDENKNQTFSDVWKSETGMIPLEVPLTQGDRHNLGELGSNLGYADRKMQERTILFYLEQLDETIEMGKAEAESLGKLYRTLGVAAGMFWFVLLI
ncbi:MAG: stage III sporulation protein AB [Lachnospiraceae bacterium]|nr:stage III sporulation protein AB [Lachnospiraceae bacterium]